MMRQRPSGTGYAPPPNYYGGYNGGGGGAGYSDGNGYGGYNGGHQSYGGYNAGTAHSSVDNTQALDDKYAKSKASPIMMFNPLVLLCVLMGLWSIAIVGLWMNVRGKYNSILTEFNAPNADKLLSLYKSLQTDLANAQQEKTQSMKEWKTKYAARQADLERENRLLQKERDELRVKYEGPDKEEEESRLLLREEAFQHQIALLQEATRKEAKRNVMERYVAPRFCQNYDSLCNS